MTELGIKEIRKETTKSARELCYDGLCYYVFEEPSNLVFHTLLPLLSNHIVPCL